MSGTTIHDHDDHGGYACTACGQKPCTCKVTYHPTGPTPSGLLDTPRNMDDWAWWVLVNPHSRTHKEMREAMRWAVRQIVVLRVKARSGAEARRFAWILGLSLLACIIGSFVHLIGVPHG